MRYELPLLHPIRWRSLRIPIGSDALFTTIGDGMPRALTRAEAV